jgi:hypothetical protein
MIALFFANNTMIRITVPDSRPQYLFHLLISHSDRRIILFFNDIGILPEILMYDRSGQVCQSRRKFSQFI